jgi:ATP-binding cassette subfamily C protein
MTQAANSPTAQQGGFAALDRASAMAATGLRMLLAWQLARTLLRLGFSATAAMLVGTVVMGHDVDAATAIAAPVLLALTAFAMLKSDRVLIRTEAAVTAGLRKMAADALGNMDAQTLQSLQPGTLAISMQRHPPAVAALVVGHRAATIMMAAGPLAAAAALLLVSWQAALLLLVLTPVMVVFFVLVGGTIRARAEAQERAFGRLAGQFADRIRTLPTILANHGLAAEEAKLDARLRSYAANTMAVLRIAFLNAGIIDFFASLSIAMLAVFLGLGHLKLAMIPGFSDLALWQSLFILMIAPDYFAPFRRFSEQYHAKAEGLAAAASLDRLLSAQADGAPEMHAVQAALRDMELPARGLVVVTGPSGSGKSTFLRRLAGIEASDAPAFACGPVAWVSADCFVPPGSLRDALSGGCTDVSPDRMREAAASVGLLDDAFLPHGLDAALAAGGANLSGGQRLRVAVARAMLLDRTVVADEPTAKLDAATAALVRGALRQLAETRLVVVASHDPALAALADTIVDLSRIPDKEAA